jgi:hypothetical protein
MTSAIKENSNQKFFFGVLLLLHSHPHISSIYIYTVGRLHFHVESLRHLPLVFFFIDDIFIIHYDSVNPPYEPNPLSLLNKISQIYIVGLDEGKNNTTTKKNAPLSDEKIDSRPLYNREKRMSMIFYKYERSRMSISTAVKSFRSRIYPRKLQVIHKLDEYTISIDKIQCLFLK